MEEVPESPHLLTRKQHKFCREYCKDLNGTQAAIRAGYSENSASQIASDLMAKPEVDRMINETLAAEIAAESITRDGILREAARIAFTNLDAVVEWGPKGVKLRDSKTLSPDVLAAVAEVNETKGKNGRRSVKMHDKLKALELLMRVLGMLKDNLKISGQIGGSFAVIIDDIPDPRSPDTPQQAAARAALAAKGED